MAPLSVDSVIDTCPSWVYPVALMVAFAGAVFLSGMGLRLLGGLVQRMRRPTVN